MIRMLTEGVCRWTNAALASLTESFVGTLEALASIQGT
jgi:hypothetical protein